MLHPECHFVQARWLKAGDAKVVIAPEEIITASLTLVGYDVAGDGLDPRSAQFSGLITSLRQFA